MPASWASLRQTAKSWLWSNGWVVERAMRSTSRDAVLQRLVLASSPSCVIDIGANRGQFAQTLRQLGYTSHILSVEPHPEAFAALAETAAVDPEWEVLQAAAGAEEGVSTLFALDRETSSSLHRPTDMRDDMRGSVVAEYAVSVRTIDSIVTEFGLRNFFLKSDAQGGDYSVMLGATDCLGSICSGVMFEGAVTPTYEAAPAVAETMDYLRSLGFELAYAAPVVESDGQILELDVIMLPIGKHRPSPTPVT